MVVPGNYGHDGCVS